MKHNDCRHFVPIDVFKGCCRKTGAEVYIDTSVCAGFLETPKCRNCMSFCEPDKEEMGLCKGLETEYWAYGDMNARTCEGYQKKEPNAG